MTVSLTVLGSSAWYATRERAAAGYLVDANGSYVWVDAGGGTWRNLLEQIDFQDLTGVLLTHAHPDHVGDVFQAFHARHYGGPRPLPKIPLWAPKETLDALTTFSSSLGESFDLKPISAGDDLDVGGANFSFFKMIHPEDAVGVRIAGSSGVIAYSGDGGPNSDFDGLAHDADWLVCEATLQDEDEQWEGHMSAAQAGMVAARCGVKHLVLTHLPPQRDLEPSLSQAKEIAGECDVRLAYDGLRIEVE
ncbi:MAG: MBL fold metallo-hydrolase [Actinomycetota bacterium]|nr:MBL fold metallo-hydrolase [Actinomycetota bacterium]